MDTSQITHSESDLAQEMQDTPWFVAKVRASDTYAHNLYAAMCNNRFVKNEVWPRLRDQTWSVSWRGAGAVVADLRGEGDYMDWYLSRDEDNKVPEGTVTDEIRADLARLGWIVR